MSKLGVSIYPEHSTFEENQAYLKLASELGFTRVFTCLLSVDENIDEIKQEFTKINSYAQSLGMEVIFDVAPSVFDKLNISYNDLSTFKDMCASGIRLDEGFGGQKEAAMTLNKENLLIEVNASQPGKYVDQILAYQGDASKLIACHNFYPQRYSGLGYQLFEDTSRALKEQGIRVAAFVSSRVKNSYGPWPIDDGLCTLEEHRYLPIDLQARHLFATGVVDDVLVANAYASEDELRSLSQLQPGVLQFKISDPTNISDVEQSIIYDFKHSIRGDMSDYMIRSTMSRIEYADENIPPHDCKQLLERGDIVILNNEYGRYKGELHIVLQDMTNDGRKNYVGKLTKEECRLLDYALPWKAFGFIQ